MEVSVIGLGLIGGSLVQALAGAGHSVLGYDNNPGSRAAARTAAAQAAPGHRWQVTQSMSAAVADRDLVFLAVPLPAVSAVMTAVTNSGYAGLISDVTSVKGPVHDMAGRIIRHAGFVGGHPMAGRETRGFTASDPHLFEGCAWVLCLEDDRPPLHDWLAVARLVLTLGARVVPTTPAGHDRAVAAVSHVPHLLAAALTDVAARDRLALTIGAGSFRDGTRVAGGPAELAAAMCAGNADAVRRTLDAVSASLDGARSALDGPDPFQELRAWFAPMEAIRSGWPATASDEAVLPARADVLIRLGQAGGWITGISPDGRTVSAARPSR